MSGTEKERQILTCVTHGSEDASNELWLPFVGGDKPPTLGQDSGLSVPQQTGRRDVTGTGASQMEYDQATLCCRAHCSRLGAGRRNSISESQ